MLFPRFPKNCNGFIMKNSPIGALVNLVLIILLTAYLAMPRAGIAQSLTGSEVITPANASRVVELADLGNGAITSNVAWSADGKALALGSSLGVWLYDATDLSKPGRLLDPHTGSVASLTFSPDGTTLAVGSHDGTIRLRDVSNGTSLRTLTGHTSDVMSVAFSPDGKTLVSGSLDATVRLWDVSSGTSLHILTGRTATVTTLAVGPDRNTQATASAEG